MKYNNHNYIRAENTAVIKKTMTSGNIWKQLFFFALPILFSNVFQQLYNAVDSIVVGRFVGHEALAAVGANNSIINVLVSLFLGLSVGAGIVVSQYYGARNAEMVSRTVHTSILMAIICAAFLTVIGYFLAKPILKLINTPDDVLELSNTYLQIYFLSMLAVIFYNVGSGILRAVGNSTAPFVYLLVGCFINIVLDYLFVGHLGMGVAGAAWATLIAQYVSAVLVLIQMLFTKKIYRLTAKKLCFDLPVLKKVISFGVPAGLQTSMYSIGNLLIQTSINSFGSVAMAGWVAASKVDNFTYAPISSFGLAVNTFAGQNFGAGQKERIKRGTYIAQTMSLITAAIMITPMLIFSRQIVAIFSDTAEVIDYGSFTIKWIVPFYCIFSVCEVLSGTLKGIGKTGISALLTFVGILVVRILWLTVVKYLLPSFGALVLVYPISWVITAIIFIIYYCTHGWSKLLSLAPTVELQN